MRLSTRLLHFSFICVLSSLGVAATAPAADTRPDSDELGAVPTLRMDQAQPLDAIVPNLAEHRVVFVGEVHTRYDHHLIQLHILRALAARRKPVAIGVEWFQQPFQPVLDRYLAGEIDEQQLLQGTEYFSRWRYDFRLYAPILRFARDHAIPVVALNLPSEVTRAVGDGGLERLPKALRKWLPDTLDRSNSAYRDRLRSIYDAHPHTEFSDFERFYTVQLLWDEGMAQRAAGFLQSHPDTQLLIFAGSGHLAYGDGIPARLERQTRVDAAIVLAETEPGLDPRLADYLVLSPPQQLPPAGMLGVTIEPIAKGGVRLRAVGADSAAARAGAQAGDRLVALNGAPIEQLADVRAAMWDQMPGNQVTMTIQRHGDEQSPVRRRLSVTLQ